MEILQDIFPRTFPNNLKDSLALLARPKAYRISSFSTPRITQIYDSFDFMSTCVISYHLKIHFIINLNPDISIFPTKFVVNLYCVTLNDEKVD